MIYIAHRGNITGPKPDLENRPDYITAAADLKFDVEIDVWCFDPDGKTCWLGHDKPQYVVPTSWVNKPEFWCHAKNARALAVLRQNDIHCFWHQTDDFTMTSKGYIWTYPGKQPTTHSVIVVQDDQQPDERFVGVCSDYVKLLKR